MSIRDELVKMLWDEVQKINDKELRELVIHILRCELKYRDQERPPYKDEYMEIIAKISKTLYKGEV